MKKSALRANWDGAQYEMGRLVTAKQLSPEKGYELSQ